MRTFLIAMLALLSCNGVDAQIKVDELWQEMPDSLMPYMDQQARSQLVSYYNIDKIWAKLVSSFDEVVEVNKLTDNYMNVSLGEMANLQMALLTTDTKDSLLCMVKTYCGGTEEERRPSESVIAFYNMKWQKMDNAQFLVSVKPSELIRKPAAMEQMKYQELLKLANPKMMVMEMDEKDLSLTLSLTFPMLSAEDEKMLDPILLQKKIKWNGKMYK